MNVKKQLEELKISDFDGNDEYDSIVNTLINESLNHIIDNLDYYIESDIYMGHKETVSFKVSQCIAFSDYATKSKNHFLILEKYKFFDNQLYDFKLSNYKKLKDAIKAYVYQSLYKSVFDSKEIQKAIQIIKDERQKTTRTTED